MLAFGGFNKLPKRSDSKFNGWLFLFTLLVDGAAVEVVVVEAVAEAPSVLVPVFVVAAELGSAGRMYSFCDVSSPFKCLRHTGHVPCFIKVDNMENFIAVLIFKK